LALLAICVGPGSSASAQPPTPQAVNPTQQNDPPQQPQQPTGPGITEKQPSLFYLPDAKGQLQPVLNLSLDRLEQLLGLKGGKPADDKPAFALELRVKGAVDQQQAKLDLDFQIHALARDWVQIPLRLDEALLVADSVAYEGSGQFFVEPQSPGRGYICWLRGRDDKPHHLRMRAVVPLEQVGDETRFRLSTPVALATSLELEVPGSGLMARAADDCLLESRDDRNPALTRLTLNAPRGPLELMWSRPPESGSRRNPALEATGAILVEVSGRRIEETALLSVRSLERPFDHFRVRLPEKSVLTSGRGPNYSAIQAGTEPDSRSLCEVRFDQPVRQADVKLVVEHTDVGEQDFVEFAGFEVLEAPRQSGHLAVALRGDWHLVWGSSINVHQVREVALPPELRREALLFNFAYVAQPSSLSARIVQRRARTVVEPSFVFLVDKQQDSLEATFHCTTTGANVSELKLNWPGATWQIDEIGPPNLVDVERLALEQRKPLVVPLVQPLVGDFELILKAHRSRAAADRSLQLVAPVAVADAYKPARFVVAPADNIRLTPRAEELVGLTRQPLPALKLLENRQQEPLSYRADAASHYFAADLEVLPGSIAAQARAEVSLTADRTSVEQKFLFQIDHEPVASLAFEVPREIATHGTLQATIDGHRLADSGVGTRSQGKSNLRLALAGQRIGPCEVTLTYALPARHGRNPANCNIPLVVAADAKPLANQVVVRVAEGLEATLASNLWSQATAGTPPQDSPGELVLESSNWNPLLPLSVRRVDAPVANPLIVDRCWIQTWLSDRHRQDRAVFRLLTNRDRVEVVLPPGALPESLQVFVDGRRTVPRFRESRRALISFAGGRNGQQAVVEVLYQCGVTGTIAARRQLDAPVLLDCDSTRFSYWQLVLPGHQFLVSSPTNFSPAYTWTWAQPFWRRQPLLEQADLEMWSGARSERAMAIDSNRYLFGSLGPPVRLDVLTLDRSLLVLLSSGAVLVAGLLLIQFPRVRHPTSLLVLAVLVLAAVLARLDAAIVIAQAASVGVLLVLLAGLLKWLLPYRGASHVVVRRSQSSIVERGSTKSQGQALAIAGSGSSTKATPHLELAQDSQH
jgi:hypothetical protein